MSHAPPPPDPDRLDAAVAAFRRMPVPERPADGVVLARLAAEPSRRSRRKLLMRVATWSLAASVLAVAGGVLLFGGSSPVALADVVKAAEKHKLVKYKMTMTTETIPPPGITADPPVTTFEMVFYADLRAPRFRNVVPEEVRGNGLVRSSGYVVTDLTKDRQLTVYANELTDKAADPDLSERDKAVLRSVGPGGKGARLSAIPALQAAQAKHTLLDQLRQLQDHKEAKREPDGKLVKYTVPGKTTTEFHTADGVTTRELDTTTVLWVDPATKLPVRLTTEVVDPDSPQRPNPADPKFTTRTLSDSTDFEWDPKLPDGVKSADDLFSLTPPAGYKLDDQTKKPAAGDKPAKP